METKKLTEMFNEPYSGRLRVHEANAADRDRGREHPGDGVKWKSRPLRGRRQDTLTIQGDADERASLTKEKAERDLERAQAIGGLHDMKDMKDMRDMFWSVLVGRFSGAFRCWGRWSERWMMSCMSIMSCTPATEAPWTPTRGAHERPGRPTSLRH